MSTSNLADLTTTTSSALQNWDAEWAAAENGKSYWDDYLSQITAEYNKELEDIELALDACRRSGNNNIVLLKENIKKEQEIIIKLLLLEVDKDFEKFEKTITQLYSVLQNFNIDNI